jgi:hypothetical protein
MSTEYHAILEARAGIEKDTEQGKIISPFNGQGTYCAQGTLYSAFSRSTNVRTENDNSWYTQRQRNRYSSFGLILSAYSVKVRISVQLISSKFDLWITAPPWDESYS